MHIDLRSRLRLRLKCFINRYLYIISSCLNRVPERNGTGTTMCLRTLWVSHTISVYYSLQSFIHTPFPHSQCCLWWIFMPVRFQEPFRPITLLVGGGGEKYFTSFVKRFEKWKNLGILWYARYILWRIVEDKSQWQSVFWETV